MQSDDFEGNLERQPEGDQIGRRRTWWTSTVSAAAALGVMIIMSAIINPLFGRYVHWDWVAVGAPIAWFWLAVALRRRWI